jgi:hypothetical protein
MQTNTATKPTVGSRLGRARAERLARRLYPDISNRDIHYHERPNASEAVAVHDGDLIYLLVGTHIRPRNKS